MQSTNIGLLSPSFLDNTLQHEKAYWMQQLAKDLAVAEIPLDFQRPPQFEGELQRYALDIDPATQQKLFSVCKNTDMLVFTVLVAALKVCLHSYTGLEDITVGTPIHERYREVSSFNKILALRSRVEPTMTLRQLLASVKRTLSDAYANQKYPLDRILSLLGVALPENRSPLFSVAILLDSINDRAHIEHLRNDLTLDLSLCDGQLSGTIVYRTQLFKPATIAVFATHYLAIVRAMVEAPDQTIGQLELLSAAKRQQLLFDFNQTASEYPRQATIHQLFEAQVERTPDATALLYGQQRFSYRELNSRANQLAYHLRQLGVGPGQFVGVLMEHAPETVVGLLGVLKAGGAYVPLDPEHPAARLTFTLADAQVAVVLTQERLQPRLADYAGRVIRLDADWAALAEQPLDNPLPLASAEAIAYVIYTSGSTGNPKGVLIQHSALVNYICWARAVYTDGAPPAFPLYSSLAFDLTVTSIYTPLISGGQLVIYPQEGKVSPLLRILEDNLVDVVKLTPSHLALIKERDNRASRIKRLIVGGEALDTMLARSVHTSFGEQVEIINEYGPTEATVGCMIAIFDPVVDTRAFVPIGKPAANTQIYILDQALRPVPENVAGELYISGDGLAQGYLNQSTLTSERFIANPFVPGQRMYKTGDLARWLPEGVIDFIGRSDDQVKFHGYRIELNEIRHALQLYPQIRDSVVTIKQDRDGSAVLVAYYVAPEQLDVAQLRAFLATRLFEATIPNLFMRIDAIPLTVNGKIDYAQLPTLEELRQHSQRAYVAPRTPMETTLAEIWVQVLGVPQVGVYDNFFELGGHSLLAMQVFSRVRELFHIGLPLRTLFDAPTLEGMAALVEQHRQEQPLQVPETISKIDRSALTEADLAQLSDAEVEALLRGVVAEA